MFCDRRPNNEIIFLIAYSNFSIESVQLNAILLTKPIYKKSDADADDDGNGGAEVYV